MVPSVTIFTLLLFPTVGETYARNLIVGISLELRFAGQGKWRRLLGPPLRSLLFGLRLDLFYFSFFLVLNGASQRSDQWRFLNCLFSDPYAAFSDPFIVAGRSNCASASDSFQLYDAKKKVAEMSGRDVRDVRVVISPYRICPLGAHIDHQGETQQRALAETVSRYFWFVFLHPKVPRTSQACLQPRVVAGALPLTSVQEVVLAGVEGWPDADLCEGGKERIFLLALTGRQVAWTFRYAVVKSISLSVMSRYHHLSPPTRSHRALSVKSSHYYDDYSRSQHTTFRDRVDPPTRPHYPRDDQYDDCRRSYPCTRVDRVDPSTKLSYLKDDYYEDCLFEIDLESQFCTVALSFDSSSSPESSSYWLMDMKYYLDHFELFGEHRIKFAKFRLLDLAMAYWASIERTCERDLLRCITSWVDMERTLCQRYLSTSYQSRLLDQLFSLRQESISVAEYKDCFDELVVKSDIREDPTMSIPQFRSGLRSDIRTKVAYHSSKSLEQTYRLAICYEQSLRSARAGR
ncbi:Galacturonokinase [Platanthera zijinensis]|uniref:Galacturonokinase n=1 Tax=Platanthera zijinensis TaxID=2320716 RepID=A0AAP0FTD3_9ASPA